MVNKNQQEQSAHKKPHFFKVLLGDFARRLSIWQWTKIVDFGRVRSRTDFGIVVQTSKGSSAIVNHTAFVHILREASKTAILQGPSGRYWNVELGKTIKGTFLCGGWSSFVEDHALKEYEFLVFRYDGNMHFSVLIFDTTACEREDLFDIKPSKTLSLCEVKTKPDSTAKFSTDVGCLLPAHAIKVELEESLKYDDCALSLLPVTCPDAVQGNFVTHSEAAKHAEIKPEVNIELPICMIAPPNKRRKTSYLSQRRPVTEDERSKAEKAAHSFASTSPFVVICMSRMNVCQTYMLGFPSSFSRKHLPRRKTNMVLRDPNGKAWVVVYIPGATDRLSGGWSLFARTNNLEEGDYCVFELVGPIEFHVHVFRVVNKITPRIKISKL